MKFFLNAFAIVVLLMGGYCDSSVGITLQNMKQYFSSASPQLNYDLNKQLRRRIDNYRFDNSQNGRDFKRYVYTLWMCIKVMELVRNGYNENYMITTFLGSYWSEAEKQGFIRLFRTRYQETQQLQNDKKRVDEFILGHIFLLNDALDQYNYDKDGPRRMLRNGYTRFLNLND